jgi:hypothetical protein
MAERNQTENNSQPEANGFSGGPQAALQAAKLGENLIAAVRAGQQEKIAGWLAPGSTAALALEIFGLGLFRLDLRLDDPRENGQLAPYDLQIEQEIALLELGVVTALPAQEGERPHLTRLYGSSLLLSPALESEFGWLIEDILPVNADGQLRATDPADALILKTHQGYSPLPLRRDNLDKTEIRFLEQMQNQPGRFNLEEQFNAVRLWRDFKAAESGLTNRPEWAAAVEYLITIFDYHAAEAEELAPRYQISAESLTDSAREVAATLGVTQFDDRYSIHPDPIAHYRQLFGELGINPHRDEQLRLTAERSKVFDRVEVPPDDDDFWGPGDS